MALQDDLRDWIVVMISTAITGVTMWMLVDTYVSAGASADTAVKPAPAALKSGKGAEPPTTDTAKPEADAAKPKAAAAKPEAAAAKPEPAASTGSQERARPTTNPSVPDGFSRKKDILQLALGLFAVVTGYFFGRAPAERTAKLATDKAQEQTKKLETVRAESRSTTMEMLNAMSPTSRAESAPSVEGMRDRLQRHLDFLNAQ